MRCAPRTTPSSSRMCSSGAVVTRSRILGPDLRRSRGRPFLPSGGTAGPGPSPARCSPFTDQGCSMTPQRPTAHTPRPLPFEAEKERSRLRTLLDLDLAAQEGRLAAAPLDPPGGGPVEVQLLAPSGEPGAEPGLARDVIPAFLLRPDPAVDTGAGVVLVAGHGRGIDALVATDPADEFHDGLAHKLARAGLTVLCPEMISFGRRRVPPAPPCRRCGACPAWTRSGSGSRAAPAAEPCPCCSRPPIPRSPQPWSRPTSAPSTRASSRSGTAPATSSRGRCRGSRWRTSPR